MPLGDLDVAAVLLSHAADEEVDFTVMGGYGHSRLREFVLGGVTRSTNYDRPGTHVALVLTSRDEAVLTVYMASQPETGLVLAKSFYREASCGSIGS